MELGRWCNSGNRDMKCYMKNGYDRVMSFHKLSVSSGSRSDQSRSTPRWRLLWRKIKKEKKKIFDCSSGSDHHRVHFSYDPYAYSQNFDQGPMWCDVDDMSRSFSARFAVPSRVFEKNSVESMVD
ncbi:hypothetical protein Tsubulata_043326 [Turnera subulata]|uniref:Uncharacterized protein n=1 Tax=Turnera subulata TaxID=218843 RepID=A0A9Q0JCQ0_9ROSI|nr:hypothetical protein Tsubulata_043326 [Turnera subulata]